MKAKSVILIVFLLFILSACGNTADENAEVQRLELKIEELEAIIIGLERAVVYEPDNANLIEHNHVLRDCDGDCLVLELPKLWAEISGNGAFKLAYSAGQYGSTMQEYIRVFENGNANIRLFPDGTFIANLFHNIKITGTYTEMTDGREIAVLFTHSCADNALVTVVGGIVNDILTIPEDWDDGHGHGMDFAYREYPLVFIGEGGQRITLNADNTFHANLADGVTIIGFYGIRAGSVTFVQGSPTFDRGGVPVGEFLLAELRTCGGSVNNSEQGNDDDDCDIETNQAPIPTQNPTPNTPPPNHTPIPIPNPAEPSGHDNDDDNDNGLEWCDECQEWH
jgi:hypothetical protein